MAGIHYDILQISNDLHNAAATALEYLKMLLFKAPCPRALSGEKTFEIYNSHLTPVARRHRCCETREIIRGTFGFVIGMNVSALRGYRCVPPVPQQTE